ncbi:MAG: ATPase, T2SS/T4P/T4SS family [Sumerlaeia bacterium]
MDTTRLQERLKAIPHDENWAIETVARFLRFARENRFSDLHFMHQRDALRARGRREGILHTLADLPLEQAGMLITRLKVLGRLQGFIHHEPQDGRIQWEGDDEDQPPIDLRVAVIPTVRGENAVIRLPEKGERLHDLQSLGMSRAVRDGVDDLLFQRGGVIYLTGPSGSGKTTTIYAMLRRLHGEYGDRLNFVTLEDPVERELEFASQVQVNEGQGLTFAKSLRSILRHDPDVIMVGEILDPETARTAVQAGMTGHTVLSTIHAGRASRVFSRLPSMGIDPYLVASATSGSIAQRLVRVKDSAEASDTRRTGLFELVRMSTELRNDIMAGASPGEVDKAVRRYQIGDILADGKRLLREGRISEQEFRFILSAEEDPALTPGVGRTEAPQRVLTPDEVPEENATASSR